MDSHPVWQMGAIKNPFLFIINLYLLLRFTGWVSGWVAVHYWDKSISSAHAAFKNDKDAVMFLYSYLSPAHSKTM